MPGGAAGRHVPTARNSTGFSDFGSSGSPGPLGISKISLQSRNMWWGEGASREQDVRSIA